VRGESALKRDLGPFLATFIVVNAIIGTGIFKTPATVARQAGTLPAALLVWAAGGLISLAGALSLAELSASMPRTGGIYEILRRAYGPGVAFLVGWTKLVLLIPSAVGSFARLAAEATTSLLGLAPDPEREGRVAALFLVASIVANLFGVRQSAVQQAVITIAKYVGVLLIGVLGCFLSARTGVDSLPLAHPLPYATEPTAVGIFGAMVSVMWAYEGWADLSSLGGEVKEPGRTLPRALVAGTCLIVAVYLFAVMGYASILGLEGLRRSGTGGEMAATNLATLTLGPGGRRAVAALVLISCVGGCMSTLLTAPRLLIPLATDGLFPRVLGTVSGRGVPWVAVILGGFLGLLFVSFRSFEQLTDAFVFGFYPFYGAAVTALFVLRRREPNLERPFRVPLYPVTPIVFVLGALAVLLGSLGDADENALFSLLAVSAGIPIYWAWSKLSSRKLSMEMTRGGDQR